MTSGTSQSTSIFLFMDGKFMQQDVGIVDQQKPGKQSRDMIA